MTTTTPYQTKYVINVDWFQCLLSGNPFKTFENISVYEFPNSEFTAVKEKIQTPHFLNAFRIVRNGRPFAQVLTHPRNPEILGHDTIQVKVENARLYEVGWLDTFKNLLSQFSWRVKNISRVDIALDGHGFIDVGQKWYKEKIMCVSSAHFRPRLQKGHGLISYELGDRSSDRSLICYDKSKELEISNKYYIRDAWNAAKLDTTANVERLEICLRNEYFKKIENFKWSELDNFEYLASLMKTALHKFYQFYYPTENARVSRCRKFDFIKWENIGGEFLPMNENIQTTEVNRFKQASKTLFLVYLDTNLETHLQHSRELAINVNCLQWWIDKHDKWIKEYEYKCGKNRDGIIHYKYLSQFKQYDIGQQITILDKYDN